MVDKKMHFPKEFLWGASVSTHQVEGGNHNQWSVWELENAKVQAAQAQYKYGHLKNWSQVEKEATNPSNYVSGKAADHINKYEVDFALAKQLNLNSMRSGIEWSRIEPEEGKFDKKALEHYQKYFAKMKQQGLEPIITLWHWTMPVWFAQKGGFERRSNVHHFLNYVQFLVDNAPELFEGFVITINEPTVYASVSYHEGKWPPQKKSKMDMFQVLVNLASAHNKAYKLIKKVKPNASIGIAHNLAYYYAGDSSIFSKASAWACNHFANEWFINRVKGRQDFLGCNYYFAWELHGLRVHNPNQRTSDLGWDMQPSKIEPLFKKLWQKYKLPIVMTESGVADKNDQYRQWWIEESLKSISNAMKNGVKVQGYIHWSLLDNFEWAEGFWPRFGLIEVDYKTQQRKVRPSAKWYAKTIKP